MSALGNPTLKSPERAFALQKYLLLHSQHDALQKHLHAISATLSTGSTLPDPYPIRNSSMSSHSSLSSSPPTSNTDRRYRSSSTSISPISEVSDEFELSVPTRPQLRTRRSSLPATLAALTEEVEEEEQKLMHVNQQIKMTLTDLLNCESVRHDGRYRMWVQSRLLDAEKELKGNRSRNCERRRSSVDDGALL
ncbi:MAG: hypothetical protein M1818_004173 [Claussenomyces sp. TS43310]|nr:MAG: hypothetical protein M1818_004173 [Claussenomyces sp. TS43310]